MNMEFLKELGLDQAQIDKIMPEFDALTEQVTKLTDWLNQLTEQLEADKKLHEDEVARISREAESREFFRALDPHFVNEETMAHYAAKLENALDDPKNRGKSRREILDALTAGEDGKPRPGIFKEPENPNKLVIPPAGNIPVEPQKQPAEVPHFW